MYTGLKLLGFPGIILGPITFILIRNILVTIYRKKPVKDIIGFGSAMQDTGTETPAVTGTVSGRQVLWTAKMTPGRREPVHGGNSAGPAEPAYDVNEAGTEDPGHDMHDNAATGTHT